MRWKYLRLQYPQRLTRCSHETIELALGNKGFFTYPFIYIFSERIGMSHFKMNLKQLNHLKHAPCSGWPPWSRLGRSFVQPNGQSRSTLSKPTATFQQQGDTATSFISEGEENSTSSRPCLLVCWWHQRFTMVTMPFLLHCRKIGINYFSTWIMQWS